MLWRSQRILGRTRKIRQSLARGLHWGLQCVQKLVKINLSLFFSPPLFSFPNLRLDWTEPELKADFSGCVWKQN